MTEGSESALSIGDIVAGKYAIERVIGDPTRVGPVKSALGLGVFDVARRCQVARGQIAGTLAEEPSQLRLENLGRTGERVRPSPRVDASAASGRTDTVRRKVSGSSMAPNPLVLVPRNA